MKRRTHKKVCVLLSVVIILLSCSYIFIQQKKVHTELELLKLADNIVNENIVIGTQTNVVDQQKVNSRDIEESNEVIGKLIIPSIEVCAPIIDGTSSEVLKIAVGHFKNTSYWNGNVVLASHNRGMYAHYFEKINKLVANDEIIYQTQIGTRVFLVESAEIIDEKNLSVLDNTQKNYLTLITCVTGHPESRLCVKAVEKI